MGHINSEAVYHLQAATEGVKIIGMNRSINDKNLHNYEVCHIAKPKRQISRVIQEYSKTPWEKVHFDMIHLTKAYNSSKKLLHFYDDISW